MPAPPSPARRVLGDKTPNASMKRRALEPMPKSYLDYLVSDEPKAMVKYAVEMDVERNVTPKTGQKRRIHEVDGTEDQEQRGLGMARSISPLTMLPTEPNSETDDREFSSTGQTKSTISTTLTSFHASTEPPMAVEDQFDIQDEMSQRTLDKIHATPIPNNTSQLQPLVPPALLTETSRDSLRMSSFIDFESNGLEEDNLKMMGPQSTSSTANGLDKAAMEEKAEALRTRLQLALYKVQTNQVSKPFSRLEQPRPSSPELPPQPPSLRRISPEGIVAAARARATQQKKPAIRNLNSLPIPTILPTAYSARYMAMEEEEAPPPSSGPSLNLTVKGLGEGDRRFKRSKTPTLGQEALATFPKTPTLLSSPPRSDVDGPVATHGQGKKLIGGLTSSVVKGEAANGLLELMRAAAA